MSRRARRLLRPLVRRLLPGAPTGGQAATAGRELVVAGADGRPVPVTEEGQGPAVLLLHAGSADRSSWAGVAAALAARFRVLRFDRWTYRDSHADAAPAGADAMAAEVRDVLAVTTGVGERPLLVGHSSGAVVALESALAAVLPRLDSVVVLEGQGHMANLRAPGEVAQVIAAFADRLAT
jgi:pimeloyl-ACP methyl ester carboxylesterase